MTGSQELIPALPDHLSMLCLLKVPRIFHASLAAVCCAWRRAVRSPAFYERRRETGSVDAWLVVLSTDAMATPGINYVAYDLSSRQLLFKVRFPPSLPPPRPRRKHAEILDTCPAPAPSCSCSCSNLNGAHHYRLAAFNEFFVLLTCASSPCTCSPWPSKHVPHQQSLQLIIYNTITDQWTRGAPTPTPRDLFACGVIGGKLYVAGGVTRNGGVDLSTDVYDFASGAWSAAAHMPASVESPIDGDVVFQGKLYVRGWDGERKQARFWAYDAARNAWQEEARLSSSVRGAAGQLVATDEFMYSVGVEDGEVHRFEQPDTWRRVGSVREGEAARGAWGAPGGGRRREDSFNAYTQRAFGHGNDIFVLDAGRGGGRTHRGAAPPDARALPPIHNNAKCHRLYLGASWYRAGAIVQA